MRKQAALSPGNLTMMAVFAHPDDEAFGVGGSLAKCAREGIAVHLVTATRGEAGAIAQSELATEANLPYVREQELRCACEVYGIHPPHFLDYVDGQLTVVHQGQAVGKVVRLIRELRPHVVLTFGPDGIYGHYDHLAVHRWVSIAVELAANPECFPEQVAGACSPHTVSKLYYAVLDEAQYLGMMGAGPRPVVMMDGVPFPMEYRRAEDITTVISIAEVLETKIRALRCHATQVSSANEESFVQRMLRLPAFQQECFVLARSTVACPKGVETDLFSSLR